MFVVNSSFLKEIAQAASEQTLPRFRQKIAIDNKYTVGFDPVTEADREAEKAIRKVINQHFPEHGILGEEFGGEKLDSSHIWVIDPIDGTRAFISGLPVWGTLVGLMVDGDARIGMMSQPFTNELFYTLGDGAFWSGPEYAGNGGQVQLKTRQTTDLSEATVFTTSPSLFKDAQREGFDRLEAQVRLSRYGVDCYAYAMLASGFADLVIESGLQPYDVMGLIPVIEQAGGVITQIDGGPAEKGGYIVAASSAALHEQALKILNA
ncbi:histidinol-phosphatase [Pseudochrobactrum sp. sp1633]|uniref:histidinol-phosphatase n=1 Tax=Pseudochrobactrum sp. sp1633 TaxID=3036706 RepID=UPI0035B51091